MRKIIPILILLVLLTSCYTIKKSTFKEYSFNQNIDFVINKIEEKNSISDYPRTNARYKSNFNDKFVLINLTLQNSSHKTQKFNFNNFYLLDAKTNTKYRADSAITLGFLMKNKNVNHQIKKYKNLNKTLVFMFPKKEKPRYLKINNRIIEIISKT
ncbi:MAG: hypothetical protein COB01_10800 [Lutibacter sp.]|nr:MAG: hypothetical protein COB01_10800 [Lutibacter sp.]